MKSSSSAVCWLFCLTKLGLLALILGFLLPGVASAEYEPAANASSGRPQRLQRPEQVPEGLNASAWSTIRQAYERHRHSVIVVNGSHQARNPGQQWQTSFDGRGFLVRPDHGGWEWGLELRSYGFAGHERAIARQPRVISEGESVAYAWDETVQEWFVNDRRGLEHGFSVQARPPQADASGSLRVDLAVRGGLRPEVLHDGSGVRFVDAKGAAVLTYAELKVYDADGQAVPARFEAIAEGVRFEIEERGARYPLMIDPIAQQVYLKASNTGAGDVFGESLAISGDTVVIAARGESSSATTIDGDQANNLADRAGAAYVFVRDGASWSQQAYLKASNAQTFDFFGRSIAIAGDTIVVGASGESSNSPGVNGNQANNSASNSGAAYVFVRSGTTWTQQAYLKASNPEAQDSFGSSVAVSGDTVVIGATFEASNAVGVNGIQTNNSLNNAGAAYVFVRNGTTWTQEAYLKSSNTALSDNFGVSVGVSGDTVLVGADGEDSNATGSGGNQSDNSAASSGAAYVFVRSGTTWTQQAYLKASNTGTLDYFGAKVAVSGDSVVVGAFGEASNATGIDGNQSDNSLTGAGAAYVFTRSGINWTQQAYLKASNTDAHDQFGRAVAISGDHVIIGAASEDGNATGINGDQTNNSAFNGGAAYLYMRTGSLWTQQAYLKASNTEAQDGFGVAVGVSGNLVLVGAFGDDSNATGVNGDQTSNSTSNSGAAYLFESSPTGWIPISGATTYCQDFDMLGTADQPWVDITTLPGWYAGINDNATPDGTLQISDGANAGLGGLLNLGVSGHPERALGSKATGVNGFANIAYGVLFQNTSGVCLEITNITYTGELWRTNSTPGGVAERWTTFTKTSSTPITDVESGGSSATANNGTFTPTPALDWASPTNLPPDTALNGNDPSNRLTVSADPNITLAPGEYFMFRWVDTNLAGFDGYQGIDDFCITFIPIFPPSITTQPGNQIVCLGQTATFAVAATGTAPLSYQWRKGGMNISGATGASYTMPPTTTSDNGATFTVVITNGCGSATSSNATLTVNNPPSITTQPSNQAVNAGETATFSVTVAGTTPLSYQWRKNTGPIAGATNASYTTPATTASDDGAFFTVVISNACGSVTSQSATLSIFPPCQIAVNAFSIIGNRRGTPGTSDDVFSFDVYVTGVQAGARWTSSTPLGPVTGAYGDIIHLGPFPMNLLPLTLTFRDETDPTCSATITISALESVIGTQNQECDWSLRVVRGAGAISNLASAISAVAVPPAGSTLTRTRVPWINHNDPDAPGESGIFPGDLSLPGLVAGVNDDNVALLGETILRVPSNGDYTFNVHSDDGFALLVSGADFRMVNGGGAVDSSNPQKLVFPGVTADSRTLGVTYLTAGDHLVQFVSFEAGGVSSWEVSWVPGAAVVDGNTRAWKLIGCPSTLVAATVDCCGDAIWEDMERIQHPSARSGHAMAWDHERGVAVLFGGRDAAGTVLDDTWLFDGVNWRQAFPANKPASRDGHSMVFDESRLNTLLFGGAASNGAVNNQTWLWDGTNWTQVATPLAITPRRGHASAWDPVSQSVVITGGTTGQVVGGGSLQMILQSAWYDATGWHQTASSIGQPTVRHLAAAVSDPQNGKVWLYGGANGAGVGYGDMWRYNGAGTWTQVSQGGITPGPRAGHAMAWDSVCGEVVLSGGANTATAAPTDASHWRWDASAWSAFTPAPGPSARRGHSMAADPEECQLYLFGGTSGPLPGGSIFSDTWLWGCPCPDEEMETTPDGQVIYPAGLTSTDFVDEDAGSAEGGRILGWASDLYPELDTTNANFYGQIRCSFSLGGPDTLPEGNPVQDLADLGVTGVTPAEVQTGLQSIGEYLAANEVQGSSLFATSGPLAAAWQPPSQPRCIPQNEKHLYLFGGRDIVFVHGIRLTPLTKNWFFPNDPDSAKSFTKWPDDPAEFYPGGWWKDGAEIYWERHIIKYLKDRGFKNRILVVAYPVTQRLDVCAQAVLAQIAAAMNTGVGVVVDPASVTLTGSGTHISPAASQPFQPGTAGFGTPSFVIVSHSMGALVTDIALTAAAENSNLRCTHIAQMCKAHLAMRGAFNGASYATAVIGLAAYTANSLTLPPWLCPLVNGTFTTFNALGIDTPIPEFECPPVTNETVLKMVQSSLFDLVPAVAQWKWGGHMDRMPVRTLTLVGGHPSFLTPVKHVLALGYDDGAPTLHSQLATPNSWLLWPSGVNWRSPRSYPRAFDMYVATRGGGLRAIDYFIDRAREYRLNPLHLITPFFLASGATPYITPHGMIQNDVREPFLINGFRAGNRRPNHFSFLQSAGDHFSQMTPLVGNGDFTSGYRQSYGSQTNNEEQLVITDSTVFSPWPRRWAGDDGPILRQNCLPGRYLVESGPRLKKNGKKRRLFRWKRTHERLDGWTQKTDVDYMYESVLCGDTALICGPGPAWRFRYFGTFDAIDQAADLSDPDFDGIANLVERAFRLHPLLADVSGLPRVERNAGRYLEIRFTRDIANTDLIYEAEVSSDLVNWTVLARSTAGAATVATGAHSVTEFSSQLDATLRTVIVEDDSPADVHPKRFIRVRVTGN